MKFFLLCATFYFVSAPSLADVTLRTCSRSPQENATVALDDLGAFHITLNLGSETFVSSICKPFIPNAIRQVGIVSIECSGDWKRAAGSVILDSMDGVLNILMYKGPEPLPSQYSEATALFCGAPNH